MKHDAENKPAGGERERNSHIDIHASRAMQAAGALFFWFVTMHHPAESKVHNSYQFCSFLSVAFYFWCCAHVSCVATCVCAFFFALIHLKSDLCVSWTKISRPHGYGQLTQRQHTLAKNTHTNMEACWHEATAKKKSKSIFYPFWFESLIMYDCLEV